MAELRTLQDPVEQTRQEVLRIQAESAMDPKEEAERVEASKAFMTEDEQHFVDYVEEMVRASADANRDIRQIQQECWRVYQEEMPPNYHNKEVWQSRVVVPKPHGAVQFAMSAVKQAFNPDFLSIEDEQDENLAKFWRKLMRVEFNRQHAKFVKRFTIASGMGFAVGQSFEMIPVWRPGRGLDFTLVEPWKIHRDPDALSQEPQSGMHWIHEEWMDLWDLQLGEERGRYVHTDSLNMEGSEENNPQNFQMDRNRAADLRKQLWSRNKFRKSVLTREYWGTVLDRQGNLLHPNLWYATAGRRVIQMPNPSPYRTLRWPGSSFSPLPNFLRFEGRSLLQSVRSLWYYMCNLQALHVDYMNWQVNPMLEINQQGLVDQGDVDPIPGRVFLTRNTVSGQQVVRTVDRRFTTNEVLANMQHSDGSFQRGTFINDNIQGLPGFRQQITARESAQNLQQSMTVFSIIGENLDVGAIDITQAAMETIMLNITAPDLLQIFSMSELIELFGDDGNGNPTIFVDVTESPTGIKLPRLTGSFHISGLQSLLKDTQTMKSIQSVILPMAANPVFLPYIHPHKIAKAIELRSGLQDEGLLVTEQEAEEIEQGIKKSQGEQAQIQTEAFQRQQQLLEARAQIEAKKSELEEAKVQIEARKVGAEIQAKELEMMIKLQELETGKGMSELEIVQKQADIQKEFIEITRIEHEIRRSAIELDSELRQTQAQIEKIEAQTLLAERKADLQEKQMQMQAQQLRIDAREDTGGDDG